MAWPAPVLSILVIALAASPAVGPPPSTNPSGPGPSGVLTFSGKVVLFVDALKGTGLEYDLEPVAKQVVLKGDDGKITPILSDDASRALFQDERLRNRRAELKGLKIPDLPYLRVVAFRVEEDGRLRIPEYYCEICSISVRYPQVCPCCQGDMVLRMKPEPD
jgi:hypothetical protein